MSLRQRIVAGTAATLSWQAADQHGEPADPGTTTVVVTRSAGSTAVASTTATEDGTARTVALPAAQNTGPDLLAAVWTGETAAGSTLVDVAGGVYFTVPDLRAHELSVSVDAEYSAADVRTQRRIVEDTFERCVGVAFVPRFSIVTPSNGQVPLRAIRSVSWVQLDDSAGTVVTTSLDDYCEISDQRLMLLAGGIAKVGVVHGWDAPPADLWRAAMRYCRHLLAGTNPGIDYRPMATINPDGSRDQFATPGVANWETGIPEVDVVLNDYRRRAQRQVRTIHTMPWVGR